MSTCASFPLEIQKCTIKIFSRDHYQHLPLKTLISQTLLSISQRTKEAAGRTTVSQKNRIKHRHQGLSRMKQTDSYTYMSEPDSRCELMKMKQQKERFSPGLQGCVPHVNYINTVSRSLNSSLCDDTSGKRHIISALTMKMFTASQFSCIKMCY